jgi:amino acid permease
MQTREYTVGLESIAEIGYALIGRPAIFAFNGILVLLCLGSITIYFNLFGSVASGFFKSAFNKQDSKNFFLDPKFYILIAAAILIYPAFKRSIKELKIISIGLFSSIILLTFTMIVYIADEGTKYNNDHNLGKYWSFKFTRETVTALSVFIFSFSFQLTLF